MELSPLRVGGLLTMAEHAPATWVPLGQRPLSLRTYAKTFMASATAEVPWLRREQ
jgi:hypothetical protein